MNKTCNKCGNSFECKADDIANCECRTKNISRGKTAELLSGYNDCLCINCLHELTQPLLTNLKQMTKIITILFFSFFCFSATAQTTKPVINDSASINKEKTNAEAVVYAFGQKTKLINTSAAVSILDKNSFQRNDPTSFVSAVNTVPGVKMDERSPGSYRISIRGNLLRSAFGVRNVKIYLNGLPFTDASGNTYFNALALNSIDKMEIIKGPAGSMYGPGNGGTILLSNDPSQKRSTVQIAGGSYGLFSVAGKYYFGNKNVQQSVSFTHQQSDGYRQQTKMRRDVAGYTVVANAGKHHVITGNAIYSNLLYQTPGGLTLAQMKADPRQARPATPVFPSAVTQKATIYAKTIYSSVSDEIKLSSKFKNTTGAYFTYTDFENPAIRNYEKKNEKGTGGRTAFEFNSGKYAAVFGGKYQYTFINTTTSNNDHGVISTLQYHDKIPVHQVNIFAQANVVLPLNFQLTAGLSYNNFHYGFNRVSTPTLKDESDFPAQYIPRVALLKKLSNTGSVYISYSKGYSPPTIDEIHATNGLFNKALNAERGTNYETGIKLNLLKNKLYADFSGYIFHLQNTIVSRTDGSGAGYYVNSGKTNQQGIEFSLSYFPVNKMTGFVQKLKLQTTLNYVHARFADYQQGTAKYSGNKLTGTSPFIFSLLADITTKPGIYSNIIYTYTDKIPLNDANTFFAKAYNLLFVKLGWERKLSSTVTADIFASMQKSFNRNYSLGNDLNADANRFFNPSAMQSFAGGVVLRF